MDGSWFDVTTVLEADGPGLGQGFFLSAFQDWTPRAFSVLDVPHIESKACVLLYYTYRMQYYAMA